MLALHQHSGCWVNCRWIVPHYVMKKQKVNILEFRLKYKTHLMSSPRPWRSDKLPRLDLPRWIHRGESGQLCWGSRFRWGDHTVQAILSVFIERSDGMDLAVWLEKKEEAPTGSCMVEFPWLSQRELWDLPVRQKWWQSTSLRWDRQGRAWEKQWDILWASSSRTTIRGWFADDVQWKRSGQPSYVKLPLDLPAEVTNFEKVGCFATTNLGGPPGVAGEEEIPVPAEIPGPIGIDDAEMEEEEEAPVPEQPESEMTPSPTTSQSVEPPVGSQPQPEQDQSLTTALRRSTDQLDGHPMQPSLQPPPGLSVTSRERSRSPLRDAAVYNSSTRSRWTRWTTWREGEETSTLLPSKEVCQETKTRSRKRIEFPEVQWRSSTSGRWNGEIGNSSRRWRLYNLVKLIASWLATPTWRSFLRDGLKWTRQRLVRHTSWRVESSFVEILKRTTAWGQTVLPPANGSWTLSSAMQRALEDLLAQEIFQQPSCKEQALHVSWPSVCLLVVYLMKKLKKEV